MRITAIDMLCGCMLNVKSAYKRGCTGMDKCQFWSFSDRDTITKWLTRTNTAWYTHSHTIYASRGTKYVSKLLLRQNISQALTETQSKSDLLLRVVVRRMRILSLLTWQLQLSVPRPHVKRGTRLGNSSHIGAATGEAAAQSRVKETSIHT